MSSMYTNTYFMGVTIAVVNTSNAQAVIPPSGCNGGMLKINTGSGTLYLANSFSQAPGSSLYPVGATEIINFEGPARFFLVAGGATMVASICFKYTSAGSSGLIAGG